jgi:hypothetical protein
MKRYVTASVKIDEDLKNMLGDLKIKTGKVMRDALVREVKLAMAEKLQKEADNIKSVFNKLSTKRVVDDIREKRRER